MKIIMENCSKDRPRWLALKAGKVGSSNIPVIVGLDSYRTTFEEWAEWTGKVPRIEDNDHLWLGREMEPVIGKLFARRTGFEVRPADCLIEHPTEERFLASPDFFVMFEACQRILEAKNANWKMREKWRGGAPVRHVVQLNWQLGCSGLKEGHVAGLLGGSVDDFEHDMFTFDQSLFDLCAEAAFDFLERVRTDTPPAPSAHDTKLIAALQGEREARTVILDEAGQESVNGWMHWKQKRDEFRKLFDEADDEVKRYAGRLLLHLGNACVGKAPNGQFIYAVERQRKGYPMPPAKWVEVKVEEKERTEKKKPRGEKHE